MKRSVYLFLIILVLVSLALPSSTALAKDLRAGKVVFGGSYRLESGQTLNGDLVIFGAAVTLEQDSVVNGSVILFGANLEANGDIKSDVVGLGGLITLSDSATVEGDCLLLGAHMDQANGAQVEGDVTDITKAPFSVTLPGEVKIPRSNINIFPDVNFVWIVLKIFLWAALATLVALFAPRATGRVAQASIQQPLVAAGLGLLTVVLAIPVALVLIITIILSPLGLFTLLLLGLCWAFGMISIGMEIGKRFATLVKREWADPVSAALGTFFLMLVLNGTNEVIPCIGWMFPAVVGVIGLGAVLMTRFGTQTYPLVPETYPYPPQPLTPPIPPAIPQPIVTPEPFVEKPASEESQSDESNEDNPA